MRVIGILFLIFLAIVAMLNILANKINKGYVVINSKLEKQNELLKQTICFMRSQLFLTTLKECPKEEKENIVKECIDFIDEIEKVW